MSLESDIYSLLSTDASVSAALNDRPFVYNGAIPKGQPDDGAIVINVSRTDRLTGADGPNRFTVKEIQFDSYAQTYTRALALSNAIFALMVTLSGSLATTEIQGTIPTKEMDFGRESAQAGYGFRRMLAFEVQYVDLQVGDEADTYTPSSIPAPGGNASLLEGVPVSTTEPEDGQVLIYSATQGMWLPGSASSSGGVRRRSFNETPDGTRTVFTLPDDPDPSVFRLVIAGLEQGPTRYGLTTNTVTLPFAPASTDEMVPWY
jgi:hypothetical protein